MSLRNVLSALALLAPALGSAGCNAVESRLVDAAVERQMGLVRQELLADDALQVFLCGTGSPLPDPNSAAACTLVLAGGKAYVVDVGPGSQEVAQLAGMPTAALEAVLLTHFHSDHIGELGEWAMQSWVAGRTTPLLVYGPQGVDDVVAGFKRAYRLDDGYRIAHHGEENLPRAATQWIPRTVKSARAPGARVLADGDLVVRAFAVDHEPASPSVGYRFDYKGRSVVISGDTDRSENLEAAAAGADVLVHEALLKGLTSGVSDVLGEAGHPRMQRLARDIVDYHASPAEAVASARAAGVGTLVLTHLVPPLPGPLRSAFFLRDIDAGEVDVVLGEDGMLLRLPAGSGAVEFD